MAPRRCRGGCRGGIREEPLASDDPESASTSAAQDEDISEFDSALDSLDCLRGLEREVEKLPGGLTNVNLKVTTSERTVVVRIPQAGSELLSIDRRAEHLNSRAAADAGVGAPVLEFLEDPFLLVIGFLDGKTFTDEDLR